jgi:ubiquitin-conjugating enzyme E2 Z
MEAIHQKLEDEKRVWEQQGALSVEDGTQLATQLAFQFTQQQRIWSENKCSGSRIELSLPNKRNPFVWDITLFGEPMTK